MLVKSVRFHKSIYQINFEWSLQKKKHELS